jgi:hypothetical protein
VTNMSTVGFITGCVFGAAAVVPLFISMLRPGRRNRRKGV